MKKDKIKFQAGYDRLSGFTLIELIVVSMIIVLLSASSIFYFFDFLDQRELFLHTDILLDEVEELDYKVKNFHISDYSLSFVAGDSYYIGETNVLGVDSPVSLSIDNATFLATFEIVAGVGTQAWKYSIYEDDKIVSNKVVPANIPQTHQLLTGKTYEIQSYLSGSTINTLFVRNMFPAENAIEFVGNSGVFSNKNNIKNTLDLTFEKGGKSHTITLE